MPSIVCKDLGVCTVLSQIGLKISDMKEDFKKSSKYLALTCPVEKKQGKKVSFDNMTVGAASVAPQKPEIGKTGVKCQYHKNSEQLALSKKKRKEEAECNATKDDDKWKSKW